MKIKIRKQEQQQVISINGQSQTMVQTMSICECGKCGHPLLDPFPSNIVAFKTIHANYEQLKNNLKYCNYCGEPVDFDIVVDAPEDSVVIISSEEEKSE